MILHFGIVAFVLLCAVWLGVYPYLLSDFIKGGNLQSDFSAGHVLFGSGFALWICALLLVFTFGYGFVRAFKKEPSGRKRIELLFALLAVVGGILIIPAAGFALFSDSNLGLICLAVAYVFGIPLLIIEEREFQAARARGWVGLNEDRKREADQEQD